MAVDHSTSKRPALPVILLTNDDGPPSATESPFLHPFVRALKAATPLASSWTSCSHTDATTSSDRSSSPLDIRVVIPNSQRSWIGKAYLIADRIKGEYYYTPGDGDGRGGERRETQRERRPGEEEWILLDGTPASCTNIGCHSLYPGQIDLVLSGPNYGRNTSSAFSLSSGTLGAALDGALSGIPAIALSYGIFDRPPREDVVRKAHEIAIKIIKRLWQHGFGPGSDADLYSVNIPLVPAILEPHCEVVWTTEAITRYSRLFAPTASLAPPPPLPSVPGPASATSPNGISDQPKPLEQPRPLDFRFSPDISALIDPHSKQHAPGTDAEVLNRGHVTVTPLKAAFRPAERPKNIQAFGEATTWKL